MLVSFLCGWLLKQTKLVITANNLKISPPDLTVNIDVCIDGAKGNDGMYSVYL